MPFVKWVQGVVISMSLLLAACGGGDSGDESGSNTPNSAPTAAITAPAAGSVYPENSSISFSGTGTDSEGGVLTDTALHWSSSADGTLGTGTPLVANTLTTGNHTITLKVTDSGGKTGEDTISIVVNAAPLISSVTATPASVNTGVQTTFSWSISDADGDTLTCRLDTNADGTDDYIINDCSNNTSQTHTYLQAGDYPVRLTVSDGINAEVQQTVNVNVVTVTTPPTNTPPQVTGFSATPDILNAGDAVTFNWTASDPDSDTLTCGLDVDADGTNDYTINDCANNASQMHSFTQAGNFQVRLSVSDGINTPEVVTVGVTVAVNAENIQPIADAGEDLEVRGQEYVVITGLGTDDDGSIVSYEWNQILGDSLLLEGQNSSVLSFEAPLVIGTELLRFQLTVIDDQGGVASDTIDVNVTDKGSRQVVSATGMRAVGYPDDYVYYSVDTPAIGRSGYVAFFGVADTSIRATNSASNSLWVGMPDNLRLIIKEGDAVDGLPSNIQFEGGWGRGGSSPPVVTESGNVGFFAALRIGAANNISSVSIMAQVNQELISVIRTGISAPGLPPTSVVSGLSDFSFTDGGMLISGTVDRVNSALWYWDYNTVTLIAMADLAGKYSVPEEVLSFDPNCSYYTVVGAGVSNQGHAVFYSTSMDRGCSTAVAILGWKDGNLYKISSTSDVIESMVDAKFNSISVLDISDDGDVFIDTLVSQPGQRTRLASWLIPDGASPKLVAMEGELIPDDYTKEIFLLGSTFLMSNSGKAFGLTANLLGGVYPGLSLLYGAPRNSQPYEYLSDVGASQLELVLNSLDVPPGYSPESVIGFAPGDPISINSSGDIVFSADVYDAVADTTHTSIWIKRNATEAVELIKPGQAVRINGSEQALTNMFFQGGSTSKGSAAQYDDTGRLFIRARTNNTFWANILVTPEN